MSQVKMTVSQATLLTSEFLYSSYGMDELGFVVIYGEGLSTKGVPNSCSLKGVTRIGREARPTLHHGSGLGIQ